MLSLVGKRARAVGFEVSETAILAGVCDLKGKLTAQKRVDFLPSSPEKTVARLSELGEELLGGFGLAWDDIYGVGVAVPGHMDATRGAVRWSKPLNWRDVPLKRLCEQRWQVDTDVMNDSIAGSLAAHFFEADRDVRNLIYIYVRFNVIEACTADDLHGVLGIGSGIIINGEPYHGEFGAAGEITTLVAHPLVDARDGHGDVFPNIDAFTAALETKRVVRRRQWIAWPRMSQAWLCMR